MANEVYTSFNISASKNSNTVTSGSQGVTGSMVGTAMGSNDVTIIGSGSSAQTIVQVASPLQLYVKNDSTSLSYNIYQDAAALNKVCVLGPSQFAYFPSPQPMWIRCTTSDATGTAFVVSIS